MNLDQPGAWLAAQRPDLVERLKTDEAHYYARHRDKTMNTMRDGPLEQEYVCDAYGGFENLPKGDDIDEVLARHSFEHLSITEARRALHRLKKAMKPGAILRLDVPDHEETLRLYRQTGDAFYVRHLLGPRRGDYGFHMMSFTRDRLQKLVEEYGFRFVAEEPNIHFYPAFCLRFEKQTLDVAESQAPRDYIGVANIPKEWKVVDVGPGAYPLKRADVYIDRDPAILGKLDLAGDQSIIVSSLEEGLPEISDKSFDYVWCSHVLEHVEDPAGCAATLSRIAKRGIVIMPSAIKESLFNFEEAEHLWFVLPPPNGGPPIFVRENPEFIARLKDEDVQKATCFLYRIGTNHDCTVEIYLQKWFQKNEAALDVAYEWEGELKLQVIA